MKMINIKQLIVFIGLVLITFSGCANRNKVVTSSLDGCVHCEKGYNLAKEGKLQEAIKEYDLAIKYQPNNANVYNNKGTVLEKLGKWHEAIKEYDLAIKYSPDSAKLYCAKGVVLMLSHKLPEAITEIDKAIKYAPNYALAYELKNIVLIELDRQKPKSKEVFDKSEQLRAGESLKTKNN